jgi:hypothetical protein
MNLKIPAIVLMAIVSHSIAKADCGEVSTRTFNGDEAVTLTYILKNSPFATKTTAGSTITWSVGTLTCHQTNRGVLPDLLPTYDCTTPAGIGPITAKALFDAMSELGVLPDGAAGHVYEQAKKIRCRVNTTGAGGMAMNPRCSMKAAWGDECS